MAIVKRESLAFAARRLNEISEEEVGQQFILYVVQHIYGSGEKRYHPVVTVAINGNRRKAKARFRRECDEAISYMMGCRMEKRPEKGAVAAPEWQKHSTTQAVEEYAREFIPQARGVGRTMLRQMWIKATPEGMFFIGPMCDANGIEYVQISRALIVAQGDRKQMAVLSQHMRSKAGFDRGISIIKEVEIDHCVGENELGEMLDYLGGWEDFRVTQIGRWPMIKDRKTGRVSPIFSGDHFASMEWMDNMLTVRKAEKAMTLAVEEAADIVDLNMAPVYEAFFATFA